jgi:hypothetical protein
MESGSIAHGFYREGTDAVNKTDGSPELISEVVEIE